MLKNALGAWWPRQPRKKMGNLQAKLTIHKFGKIWFNSHCHSSVRQFWYYLI